MKPDFFYATLVPGNEVYMPETVQKFIVGAQIKIFRDAGIDPVDKGVVLSIEDSAAGSPRIMEVRSIDLYPQEAHKYGLFPQGWKMVFLDATTGTLAHSGETGPVFRFEL